MSVATEILRQLGGNRFLVMTGAKGLVGGKDYLAFSIGRNSSKANKVKITLTPMDVYTVEFMRYSPSKCECVTLRTVENVYNDNLQEVFTGETGLYTRL